MIRKYCKDCIYFHDKRGGELSHKAYCSAKENNDIPLKYLNHNGDCKFYILNNFKNNLISFKPFFLSIIIPSLIILLIKIILGD